MPYGLLLDWHARQRAPFGPRAVIDPNIGVVEQVRQNEPRLTRAAPHCTVGDDLLVGWKSLGLVEIAQVFGSFERAVWRPGVFNRHQHCAGHVASALVALRRK